MERHPKILILILSTHDERYDGFIEACRKTWVSYAESQSVQCLFYRGGATTSYISGDTLNLVADDSLPGTGEKLLKAFEFIENQGIDYDFIFRTNLSSFIYIDNLVQKIKQIADDNLYAGILGSFNNSIRFVNRFEFLGRLFSLISKRSIVRFASGSGFLISRNNIREVLADRKVDLSLIDDVMLGESLGRMKRSIQEISRIDLNDERVTFSKDLKECPDLIKTCYHIRLKSSDRELDVSRFYILNNFQSFPVSLFKA